MKCITWLSRGLVPAMALTVAGCAGATQLTTVWTDPALEPLAFRRIMVIGIAGTPTARRIIEDRFAAALRAEGVTGEPSYALVGDEGLDSARTSAAMHRTGCDAVLVARIVDQKTVTTFHSQVPATYGVPWQYRLGWYNYYDLGYAYLGSVPFSHEDQVVNFETNLYRVADGQLVWSALSQEWLGRLESPPAGVEHYVRQLVSALRTARVVGRTEAPHE